MSMRNSIYVGPYLLCSDTRVIIPLSLDDRMIRADIYSMARGSHVWLPNVSRPREMEFDHMTDSGIYPVGDREEDLRWLWETFAAEIATLKGSYGQVEERWGIVVQWS